MRTIRYTRAICFLIFLLAQATDSLQLNADSTSMDGWVTDMQYDNEINAVNAAAIPAFRSHIKASRNLSSGGSTLTVSSEMPLHIVEVPSEMTTVHQDILMKSLESFLMNGFASLSLDVDHVKVLFVQQALDKRKERDVNNNIRRRHLDDYLPIWVDTKVIITTSQSAVSLHEYLPRIVDEQGKIFLEKLRQSQSSYFSSVSLIEFIDLFSKTTGDIETIESKDLTPKVIPLPVMVVVVAFLSIVVVLYLVWKRRNSFQRVDLSNMEQVDFMDEGASSNREGAFSERISHKLKNVGGWAAVPNDVGRSGSIRSAVAMIASLPSIRYPDEEHAYNQQRQVNISALQSSSVHIESQKMLSMVVTPPSPTGAMELFRDDLSEISADAEKLADYIKGSSNPNTYTTGNRMSRKIMRESVLRESVCTEGAATWIDTFRQTVEEDSVSTMSASLDSRGSCELSFDYLEDEHLNEDVLTDGTLSRRVATSGGARHDNLCHYGLPQGKIELQLDDYCDRPLRECYAPHGDLGLKFCSKPGQQWPMVSKVFRRSPLQGFLQKGEFILAVEGEATDGMSLETLNNLLKKHVSGRRKITILGTALLDN